MVLLVLLSLGFNQVAPRGCCFGCDGTGNVCVVSFAGERKNISCPGFSSGRSQTCGFHCSNASELISLRSGSLIQPLS